MTVDHDIEHEPLTGIDPQEWPKPFTAATERWSHIEVWVQGAHDSDLDRLFDAVADAAFDHEPAGCDVHVSGAFTADKPEWAS